GEGGQILDLHDAPRRQRLGHRGGVLALRPENLYGGRDATQQARAAAEEPAAAHVDHQGRQLRNLTYDLECHRALARKEHLAETWVDERGAAPSGERLGGV